MSVRSAPGSSYGPAPAADAWMPILATCYAIAITAGFMFVASGFASVTMLRDRLGAPFPGAERLAPFWALAVIAVLGLLAGVVLARRRVRHEAEGDLVRAAAVLLCAAVVLAFPPMQWLTFGRPDPSTVHHHGESVATTDNQKCDAGAEADMSMNASRGSGETILPLLRRQTVSDSGGRGLRALTLDQHLRRVQPTTATLPLAGPLHAEHGANAEQPAAECGAEHVDDGHAHAHSRSTKGARS